MSPKRRRLQDELKQTRPFRSPAAEATVAIVKTADVLKRRLARLLEPYGVSPQAYNVLRILRGANGKPMATLEIASRLIEQAPGITRLLDGLEAKELVRRERCKDDRRQVHCFITPSGLEVLRALDPALNEAEGLWATRLSSRELKTLIGALEKVRAEEP